MDIFSHALWANIIFQQADPATRYTASALSAMPDLIPFVPSMLNKTHLKMWLSIRKESYDEVAKKVPPWVYRIYDITHSIPIWTAGFLIAWLVMGSIPWAAFGWLLHILIDIPTHPKNFFPTPFLWPLSNFRVTGINWAVPWFVIVNFGTLAVLYYFAYFR